MSLSDGEMPLSEDEQNLLGIAAASNNGMRFSRMTQASLDFRVVRAAEQAISGTNSGDGLDEVPTDLIGYEYMLDPYQVNLAMKEAKRRITNDGQG